MFIFIHFSLFSVQKDVIILMKEEWRFGVNSTLDIMPKKPDGNVKPRRVRFITSLKSKVTGYWKVYTVIEDVGLDEILGLLDILTWFSFYPQSVFKLFLCLQLLWKVGFSSNYMLMSNGRCQRNPKASRWNGVIFWWTIKYGNNYHFVFSMLFFFSFLSFSYHSFIHSSFLLFFFSFFL